MNTKTRTEEQVIEILSSWEWPETSELDMAFPTFTAPEELVELSNEIRPTKGIAKFNELFFSGGKIKPHKDVKDTWKEKALLYALSLKGSFNPKHEDKEAVCGLIFQYTLIL